jgi:hypothetical protein
MRLPLIILILTCIYAPSTSAQILSAEDQSPPLEEVQAPRFEVGTHASLLVSSGGVLLAGIAPRFTINTSRRDSIDLIAEIVYGIEQDGLNGLYIVQYRGFRSARSRNRNAVFWTIGGGGSFHYHRVEEYRDQRPDGSVFVRPGYTSGNLSAPLFWSVGIGFERVFARYAATRAELHAYVFRGSAVGVKGTYGVSIPIGGYRGP